MSLFAEFFTSRRQLRAQRLEIAALQRELDELRARNESMREGMRRCLSCEYRIDFKQRQGDGATPEDPSR